MPAAPARSAADASHQVIVRELARTEYGPVFRAMRDFTANRGEHTADELWFTEHEPVFTQGQAGKSWHVLAAGDIPVVQTDRGGQVTYHGPGQIVGYLLFDLRRMGLSVRGLVSGIESAVIDVLAGYGIAAEARPDAPGVYVDGAKIAALGLRVRRHCSYHGLSFNVDMDLEPFRRINPCGMSGLEVTRLKDLCGEADAGEVKRRLLAAMAGSYPVNFRKPGRTDAFRA
ncbi:MAG: lipoyl(octanoyl) transferase LipB [Gammaproteobacteria bacterium]|nr:lipoyl(octanoyl) transferase LipB [Gammaproteobacteria bacterium]MDE0366158.1 lipoyl(octanoyl) transferase LipB [Gammaproteobacteria bacterium]